MTAVHFHHRHDVGGCTDTHDEWTDADRTILATLDRLGYMIMAISQQSADHAADLITELIAKVDSLEAAQAPAVDSSKLDAAAAAADALLNPAPVDAPAEPAPADVPAPVDAVPVDAQVDPQTGQPAPVDQPADPAPSDTTVIPAQSIPSVPLA